MRLWVLALISVPATLQLSEQARLPIIDMHLHALAANAQGPPPVAVCTPIDPFPAWDPAQPYDATFMAMLKKPPCVIERSIAVIEEAPFLNADRKRDILYKNAARFLHLSHQDIARHYKQ